VTSFTVDPGSRKDESVVTIATELASRSGFLGAIERFMTRKTLQRLYRRELGLLDSVAREHRSPDGRFNEAVGMR
jgi:hypothetical protein